MKIIVGLGNPGSAYNFTRHNFGFLSLDFYAKVHNLKWQTAPKFQALQIKTAHAILIKPQTFYNDTGISVQKYLHFFKLNPNDLLVICDDLNLPFGTTRLRHQGTHGGNNGLKSIIASLQTEQFTRLRIGTKNPSLQRVSQTDFVLGKFTPDEKTAFPSILTSVQIAIDDFLQSN